MQVAPSALLQESDEMLATLIELLEEQAEEMERNRG